MINLFERLKKEGLDDYIFIMLSYIFEASEIKNEEDFREIIRSGLSNEEKEKVVTLAELFRQKGYEEAMVLAEQRLQKDKLETALNFLKLGNSIEKVAQATRLLLQEVRDLWQQNTSKH